MTQDWRRIARSTVVHAVRVIEPHTIRFRCGKTRPLSDTAPAKASDIYAGKLVRCWVCDQRKRLIHKELG
jgi:hypothetical protein